ncbi:DivIVA domain-containing protein [Actinoplanes sp. NPDC023801]|uniref:DivIVA domain-containing protein n=1 Tax=Actinoplanes sp. NPDC023801 TaxID=3154595 RepID=UPI0033D87B3C
MPITPADIHNMDFRKPPIGKRGYDEEEVDAFLDEAGQELIRLIEENDRLAERLRQDRGAPADPAATTVLNGEVSELAARLMQLREGLARAEQEARDAQARLEQARREARSAPPEVRGNGMAGEPDDRVLMMAQRTADEHVRDAQRESDQLLADAQVRAEQVTGEARRAAGALEADAERQHTEAMDDLARSRAALLEEIDNLGQLAVDYRAALGDHVVRQLHDLEGGPGVAGPAGLPGPA